MTDELTQREVWQFLQENGPHGAGPIAEQLRPGAFCTDCDREYPKASAVEDVKTILRKLKRSGHVSITIDWKWGANDTDELQGSVSPFGAGGGTFEGDEPPDEP